MTPAIDLLKKNGIAFSVHQYEHDPRAESYGLEAAESLKVDPERVFKTLVLESETGELLVAMLPVSQQLNLKAVAKATGVKKVQMADKQRVSRSTGYVLGGVSPFGQKKRLRSVLDSSASDWSTIYLSAGKRGLEIELAPQHCTALLDARLAAITQAAAT